MKYNLLNKLRVGAMTGFVGYFVRALESLFYSDSVLTHFKHYPKSHFGLKDLKIQAQILK